MPRNLDKNFLSRIPSLEICVHCIVKYVMTPQPQFTSGAFFYFSPEREKGDRLELIIIKQPYMLIFFKLHRERSVSSNHTLERRHERETNAKKMSRKELKMATKERFVKEEIGHLFLIHNLCRSNNRKGIKASHILSPKGTKLSTCKLQIFKQ
jgi:hypothetical protein